jgi:hypothetical protein
MAKKLTDRQRFDAWWRRQGFCMLMPGLAWAAWMAAIRSERRRGKR